MLPEIIVDVAHYSERNRIGELHIDRGYVASNDVQALAEKKVPIVAKPWHPRSGTLYSKSDFKLDLDQLTITCPSGNTEPIRLGTVAHFPAETCAACPNRARCTTSAESRGRSVSIAADEPLQKELREAIATPKGRARLRRRVMIEHRLAHHARKQGHRARYIGRRKNVFDARRHAATINLERLQLAEAA